MDKYEDIMDAIVYENVELLPKLLQDDDSLCDNIHFYLDEAIETGNTEILKVIIEKWPFEEPIDSDILSSIPSSWHSEEEQLEMIKVSLPKFDPEDPNWPDFYPIEYLFDVIVCCCTEKSYYLVEFFITHFYSEKYNSYYPLIKKLEAAVEKWQHIGIFLHDGIDYSSYCTDETLWSKQIKNVSKTFLQLLKKGTRESMDLAVETFQVLAGINCLSRFEYFLRFGAMLEVEQTLNDPLITKLSFKLIYNSINDKTQRNIYQCIDSWVHIYHDPSFCSRLSNRFAMQALNPFIQKPLQKLIEPYQTSSDQKAIFSLKELSRDVIRSQVYHNVGNVKEFMDRIWSFNLPLTVKCFLLHIPDASWMEY